MPRGDRTGPFGLGARTGRKAGFCAGWNVPGFLNPLRMGRRKAETDKSLFSGITRMGKIIYPVVKSTGLIKKLFIPFLGGAMIGAWTQRNNIRKLIGSGTERKYIEGKGGE